MKVEDQSYVIKVLRELGFVQGAAAYHNHKLVHLVTDPFFYDSSVKIPEPKNVAYVEITHGTDVETVAVSELENPHTLTDSLSSLIDDIKNNETPVKEAWVTQLESLQQTLKNMDPLWERRRNQYILIKEAEKLEMEAAALASNAFMEKEGDLDLLDVAEDKRTISQNLYGLARAFDRDDKDYNQQAVEDMDTSISLQQFYAEIIRRYTTGEKTPQGQGQVRTLAWVARELRAIFPYLNVPNDDVVLKAYGGDRRKNLEELAKAIELEVAQGIISYAKMNGYVEQMRIIAGEM